MQPEPVAASAPVPASMPIPVPAPQMLRPVAPPPPPVPVAPKASQEQLKKWKELKKPVTFFSIIYAFFLFFMLFPLPFPPMSVGGRFGEEGYGIRHQIGSYFTLAEAQSAVPLQVFIYFLAIVLIIATILAISFAVVSLILVNYYGGKRKEINLRLLRVFNLTGFVCMAAIFAISAWLLTFTFICAFILMLFALLINLKPSFVRDFLVRKDNQSKNSSVMMFFLVSVILAFCFSPVFRLDVAVSKINPEVTGFSAFSLIISKFADEPFMAAISLAILIITVTLFLYLLISYLLNKNVSFIIVNIGHALNIVLNILVGAYALITRDSGMLKLEWAYFLMIAYTVTVLVIYFVQKALDYRDAKKTAEAAEIPDQPNNE